MLGTPSITDPKAKYLLLRMDPFKEFLSKEVSGRKVELDEVVVPSLELETTVSEEANDDDNETSDQVTTEPRRSTRVRSMLEWYGNPVLKTCY